MGAYDAALKFLLTNIQDNAPHIVAQVAQGHLAALADEDAAVEKHLDLDSDCHDPDCFICSNPPVTTSINVSTMDAKAFSDSSAHIIEALKLANATYGDDVYAGTPLAMVATVDPTPIAEGDGNTPA